MGKQKRTKPGSPALGNRANARKKFAKARALGIKKPKTTLLCNASKGVFGEAMADAFMSSKGFTKLNGRDVQIGDRPRGRGIDGVYENSNPPPEFVVAEAKYGSSRLGMTRDGRQMSPVWVDKRLNAAVKKRRADAIRAADLNGGMERWVLRVDKNGKVTRTKLGPNQP